MMEIVFNNPSLLWFLLAIPLLVFIHFFTLKKVKKRALKFSNFEAIAKVTRDSFLSKPYTGLLKNKNIFLLIIRSIAISSLIFAVAGTVIWYQGKTTDFDFILAIDASSSMLADDFSPNRLEATKTAASLFIDNIAARSSVGLVTFSGTSFVNQKITEDHPSLKNIINNIRVSQIGGTDLASALITSTNLLITSDKGKVIILLTDGQSNVGLPVEEGILYTSKEKVTVHTIGVGTEEGGRFSAAQVISKLDETSLKHIAERTGGKYFKASSGESLIDAYNEIAGLNTRKVPLNLSSILIGIVLVLLFLEWVLLSTKYRTIP
ncbi:MAG: VWA domain-containing protein [Nanoarchaeota archaeon]|nr:VWA domain-containing protein [Nanoarchaeota archaeon]